MPVIVSGSAGETVISGSGVLVSGSTGGNDMGVPSDKTLVQLASGSVTFNIGNLAGDDFKVINAGGTSVLHVEGDTQRVGIGNTAPASELHIGDASDVVKQVITIQNDQGKSEIGVARAATDILPQAAAGDLILSVESGNDLLLGTGNAQRMIIDSAGNVGIGTMDPPDYLLEVNGTTDLGSTTTFNNGTAGLIGWNMGDHKWILRGEAGIDMSLGGDGEHDLLYISGSTGDVGIGTVAPEAKLHVHEGDPGVAPHAGAKDFLVESNGTVGMSILGGQNNSARIYFGSSRSGLGGFPNRAGQIDYNLQDNVMKLATSGSTRMVIDSAGNVGIGVTDPDTALEIFDTSDQLKLSYDANNYATQAVKSDGELVLFSTGSDGTLADITLDPASRIINFGVTTANAATHNHLVAANGRIEERYKFDDASFFTIYVKQNPDETKLCVGDGKQVILTTIANRLENHDHAAPADPTLFIHSNTDPAADNTQWVSLAHNQTNGVIQVDSGDLILSGTANNTTPSIAVETAVNHSSMAMKVAETLINVQNGVVTADATSLIPANSFVIGLGLKVVTATSNAVNITDMGTDSDPDYFATGLTMPANNTMTRLARFPTQGANESLGFNSATDVRITMDGDPGAAGQFRLALYYYSVTAPTS